MVWLAVDLIFSEVYRSIRNLEGYTLMKPIVCENCIVQRTCSQVCDEVVYIISTLDHDIKVGSKYIFTRNGYFRKRLKSIDVKRYGNLIDKWNKYLKQRHSMMERAVLMNRKDTEFFFTSFQTFKSMHDIILKRKPKI